MKRRYDLKPKPRATPNVPACIQGSKNRSNSRENIGMKHFIWTVGGICAAAAGLLVWGSRKTPRVEELAHQLDQAWADHHTVV
jgi:hypothetical protein